MKVLFKYVSPFEKITYPEAKYFAGIFNNEKWIYRHVLSEKDFLILLKGRMNRYTQKIFSRVYISWKALSKK